LSLEAFHERDMLVCVTLVKLRAVGVVGAVVSGLGVGVGAGGGTGVGGGGGGTGAGAGEGAESVVTDAWEE
jgi:hypothetical protein